MTPAAAIQRKARNIIFTSSRFARGLFSGFYRSVFRGPGLEIEEVRPYQEGDDIKSIDWNVTARTGAPHTKRFREERELPVFIVFDVSASMDFGTAEGSKREWGAIAAAALSYAAVYNSDRIGAVLFSRQVEKWIKPGRGTIHAARCVKEFLEFSSGEKGSDMNNALKSLYTAAVRRGICFLVSDFKLDIDPLLLWRLRKRQDLVALRIIDPAEITFPGRGYTELKDLETGSTVPVLGGEDLQEYYRRQAEEFRRNGLEYTDIYTDRDPLNALYLFFKRRARQ
jgi:uncharacterized protein (DUF58 family)